MALDIVIVDDHRVVRECVRSILARDPEFRVVGEAEDGNGALAVCMATNPSLVLMDISLPGVNGIEATVQLIRLCPNAKVVILSMYDDERSVMGAIRAGARGFVLKQASFTEVLNALRVVARGGTYLSSAISSRLVAEGKSSKEAATILKLEHSTIRSYRKTMMKKLGVSHLAGLIQIAVAAGLIPGRPPGAQSGSKSE